MKDGFRVHIVGSVLADLFEARGLKCVIHFLERLRWTCLGSVSVVSGLVVSLLVLGTRRAPT